MVPTRKDKIKNEKINSCVATTVILILALFLSAGIGAAPSISKYYRTISGTCQLLNLNSSSTQFDDGAHFFQLAFSKENQDYFNSTDSVPCHVVFPQTLARPGPQLQTQTPLLGFYFGIGGAMILVVGKEIITRSSFDSLVT